MPVIRSIPSRLASVSAVFVLLGFIGETTAGAARPAEACASFTDDGGWCWFSDPRAVSRDGRTYSGWVTGDGSIQAGCLDHASGTVTLFTLHEAYERDDHDNPSFLFLPDGRLMAFYTRHSELDQINSRTTTRPGDITAWEPEVVLPIHDQSPKRSGITYANPFMLSDENNAIYLFWRGVSYKPTMARSLDGGKTWSAAQPVFSREGLPAGNRPYAKYASNGKDRIHFLFTDGHPRVEPENSIYYACYRGGALYKADGTRICGVEELPLRPEQADLIYDARKTGVRAWIWGIAFDEEDRPVVAYTRLPEETDHRYHYARWTGEEWVDTELCAAGRWFPQTPAGQREREPHYSSGLALDPDDPSIVYLTRPVNGVRELEKWTTADGGRTWKSEAITAGSEHDNVRPFVVRNHAPDGPTVLWENLSGHYIHYTDYRASIKLDRPAQTRILPVSGVAGSFAPLSDAIEPRAILSAMERVADWQLAHPSRHDPTDWTQGAGDAGIMALAGISGDPKYRDAMLRMGEQTHWKLGRRLYHADDHAVGQTYAELYLQYRDPKMIAPMQTQFDRILANPPNFPSLDFTQKDIGDLWSWCDSLFMAPPTWMRLYAVTGEERYRDFAVTHWWRTSDYLYDTEEHLFFRDSTYFDKRESNGAKIFWSRGNGWVMAGLVRVLEYLPTNDPARDRFDRQFKEMSAAVLQCQQPDGLWRSSLLDPESYPLKETSGSGFYTYALAWGINQGLLDRKTFEPTVRRAWTALVGCVTTEGKLTHVQPIGADPRRFDQQATEVYGVGAFLLAGSEVYRMAVLETAKPVRVEVRNSADFSRSTETVSVTLDKLPEGAVVMDGLGSRILGSQPIGSELLFQVDLAPRETRRYVVVASNALAAVPPPIIKTYARFVPERMDDFAWESDRIAFRMYGPALITGEGTISSGVDVWVKSTRDLVINKWYRSGDYHADHGEGLDGYKVGPTRGCGGLGLWDGSQLHVSGNFATQRVIATGPIRSVFELTYAAWDAGGRTLSEVKRLSIDANSNFTRAESTFTSDRKSAFLIGIGIVKREGKGTVVEDRKQGWLAYWEPDMPPNGHTGCGVILPEGVKDFTTDGTHLLAVGRAKPGKPYVYYFGAGWSKSGDFCDAAAWEKAVKDCSRRLASPLRVSLAR